MRSLIMPASLLAILGACAPAPAPSSASPVAVKAAPAAADIEAAHKAHEAYVEAINTNDTAKVAAVLTDDIVYQSPHEPAINGKAAVSKWIDGYFGAYKTVWVKTSLEFTVSGDWAFELYSYKSVDTPKAGGAPSTDIGKGINIYHHDADGVWRVARDGWSSDLPIPAK